MSITTKSVRPRSPKSKPTTSPVVDIAPAHAAPASSRRDATIAAIADRLSRAPGGDVHMMLERAALGAAHYLRTSGECTIDQHVRACGLLSVARDVAVSLDETAEVAFMRHAADALELCETAAAEGRAFALTFAGRIGTIMIRTRRRRHDAGDCRVLAALLTIEIDSIEVLSSDATHGTRECFLHGLEAA